MSGPKEEIESYIKNELPANFTSDEIMDMENLQKDITQLRRVVGMTDAKLGMICQQNHKKFAFSYPVLFFRSLKGELNPETLKKILKIKSQMDEKESAWIRPGTGSSMEPKKRSNRTLSRQGRRRFTPRVPWFKKWRLSARSKTMLKTK